MRYRDRMRVMQHLDDGQILTIDGEDGSLLLSTRVWSWHCPKERREALVAWLRRHDPLVGGRLERVCEPGTWTCAQADIGACLRDERLLLDGPDGTLTLDRLNTMRLIERLRWIVPVTV